MQLSPGRQTRNEPATGKGVGRCHPEGLLVAVSLHGGDRVGKRLKPVADRREESCSGVGERKRPWSAAEQSAATILLKQPDLVADRGWRHAEFCRGLLETQMAGGSIKGAELDEGRQLVHPGSLDEISSS